MCGTKNTEMNGVEVFMSHAKFLRSEGFALAEEANKYINEIQLNYVTQQKPCITT